MRRLKESEIVEKLQGLEFQALKINCRTVGPNLLFADDFPFRYRPDVLLEVVWKTKTYQFVAEIKSVSTPKLIDQAIWNLQSYLEYLKNRPTTERYYPLIIAPYLNDRILEELIQREISGIDLSGNSVLIVPDQLFYYKSGQKNKYPSDDPIKNVYRWSSSIVARVFLSKPEFATVGEVYDEIISREGRTSLGTVSKVIKAMEDDLLISRRSGIRLIDGKGLLTKLAENYRTKGRRQVRRKVPNVEKFVRGLTKNCDSKRLLYAIDEPERYVVFPSIGAPVKIYLESIDKGFDGLEFEDTDRFANVQLLETSEASYYFDRQVDDGTYYTSPVQTYLDLMKAGKREREVAEQLADRILMKDETE